MSKTKSRRARRAQQRKKRQRMIVGVTALGVVLVTGLIWFSTRSASPISSDITIPGLIARPYADGKALGSAGAPVLMEEYSDFQ